MSESAKPSNGTPAAEEQGGFVFHQTWKSFLIYTIVRNTVLILAKLYFRVSVKGGHNIPKTGPVLLAVSHASHLDPPLVSITTRRHIRFMAKMELFGNPKFGWLIRNLGAFPIKRGESDRNALRFSAQVLKDGQPLLVFPEGSRSKTGKLGEAQTGISMIINQVPEAAIVPIRIDGSYDAWPPGQKYPSPRKIRIHIGKAFRLSDLEDLPTVKKQLYQEIGRRIMTQIMES